MRNINDLEKRDEKKLDTKHDSETNKKTYQGRLIIDPMTLEPIYIENKNVSYTEIKEKFYIK